MRNQGLRRLAETLGVALVALKSYAEDWRIPGVPADPATDGRVEFDYLSAVVADLKDRHGVDTDRMILAGFSAGGMMVWTVACAQPGPFAGFVPIAGTFWDPVPARCPGAPRNLIHIHGTSDRIVPMAGRPIASTRQGDVAEAMALFQAEGGFSRSGGSADEEIACEHWTAPGRTVLHLCLHDGGHSFRTLYLERAWRVFEAAGAL